MPNSDDNVGRLASSLRRGCIVAAAGCGKTYQIATATAASGGKRLILTHTHAGVDAITTRLKERKVPTPKYHVDTIAGWCLRVSRSFPHRSGLDISVPLAAIKWEDVYQAGARLIRSGALSGVLHASYCGVFVDEYQDCSRKQHAVIQLLADELPCCVFGDHLQGIFDFGDQNPVDWESDVYSVFPKADELTTPWRWKKAGNEPLSEWLINVRREIEDGNTIDLSECPSCVTNVHVPTQESLKRKAIANACLAALKDSIGQEQLVVLSAAAVEDARAALAKQLASWGFSNIEPMNCKALACAASIIDQSSGIKRFKALLDFACECMTKTEKSELEKAIESHRNGGRRGKTKFHELFPLADRVIETGSADSMTRFLETLREREKCHTYRREMLYSMYSALRITGTSPGMSLVDAVADVQIRLRHSGRRFGKCSVGSILLIKGLEFDHSVICHDEKMSHKDWYVALTRATKTVRILASSTPKIPAARPQAQVSPAQSSFVFPN